MGWSNLPLAQDSDAWFDTAFWNQFLDACKERCTVAGIAYTGPAVPPADWWPTSAWITSLQQQIETLVPHFVDYTTLHGSAWPFALPPAFTWHDAGAHDITLATLADVGGGGNVWSRKPFTGQVGNLLTFGSANGYATTDDAVPAEYINEMYRVLDWLRVPGTASIDNCSVIASGLGGNDTAAWSNTMGGPPTYFPTANGAWTELDGLWTSGPWNNVGNFLYHESGMILRTWGYVGYVYGSRSKLRTNTTPVGMLDVDFYVYVETPDGFFGGLPYNTTFASDGLGVDCAGENMWSFVETVSNVASGVVDSTIIVGNDSTIPPRPPDPALNVGEAKGWKITTGGSPKIKAISRPHLDYVSS